MSTPADSRIVTSRNTAARPGISIGRSGRTSLTTMAISAGSASAHAIHIAASRANAASSFSFNGNDLARRIVKQRRQLQIEFGVNPEQQSDDERQAQRDEKSGPVHGAGFSRGGWR